MKKAPNSIRYTWLFLAVLTLIVSIVGRMHKSNDEEILITKNGEVLHKYNIEEISSMPSIEMNKKIYSEKHGVIDSELTGVPLRNVIADADKELLLSAEKFTLKGTNEKVVSLSAEEVRNNQNILLICLNDGEHEIGPYGVINSNNTVETFSIGLIYEIEIN